MMGEGELRAEGMNEERYIEEVFVVYRIKYNINIYL